MIDDAIAAGHRLRLVRTSGPGSGTVPSTSKKLGEILAPRRPSGSPNPVSVDLDRDKRRHARAGRAARRLPGDEGPGIHAEDRHAVRDLRYDLLDTAASRPGSWYGNGESSTECTRENTTVVAPMPNAKVRSVVRVKSGWAASARPAWRTSRHRSSSAGPARKRVTVGSTRSIIIARAASQDRVLRLLKVRGQRAPVLDFGVHARLGIARRGASADGAVVDVLELLRYFLDDLRLALRRASEPRQPSADVCAPVRHG